MGQEIITMPRKTATRLANKTKAEKTTLTEADAQARARADLVAIFL